MRANHRNPFVTIQSEGALLPPDLLARIAEGDKDLAGLRPADYHLVGNERINEAINRSWNRLVAAWEAFKTAREKISEGQPGTTETRERWLLPLFQELGYGRLQTRVAYEIDGKTYPISHLWGHAPIHLVGCNIHLDRRTPGVAGAARTSPHSMVQEYLNRTEEHLWAFVSNGLRLRVLRDNVSLTRQAYVEFDLQAMMEGEQYADFALLWLLCHQSRVEGEKPEKFWLERWSQAAQERGSRALDNLRDGVEQAIAHLGRGFLAHPANSALVDSLRVGDLSTHDYYRQLLRLVYRLIFLFVAEDRGLLHPPESDTEARKRYKEHYSTQRLRQMAARRSSGRHADLYHVLRLVTARLGSERGAPELALPPLGSFLFSDEATADLNGADLPNADFLDALRALAYSAEDGVLRPVDYKNLGAEELGSVYESLLELQPEVNIDAHTFELKVVAGHERKTSGSYYTPTSLIQVLLDSALEPVIQQALTKEDPTNALLNLKVCDPACGSGHFLIAAAHRIAKRLAALRSGDEEPAPEETRKALREVIAKCIFGVDLNEMAVELCKVGLWMESMEPSKPLTFLDSHIKYGNSLVGVGPGMDIKEIPDAAFQPAFGDDRATATALRRRNKREREGQLGFRWDMTVIRDEYDLQVWLEKLTERMESMPQEDYSDVHAMGRAYADLLAANDTRQRRLELDLWTAAFFWPTPAADAETMLAPTQQELLAVRAGQEPDAELARCVERLASEHRFFHWAFEFPLVFEDSDGGFDCVLGNPPWESMQLREAEYFAAKAPQIARAVGSERKLAISDLENIDERLSDSYYFEKRRIELIAAYCKSCGGFPLTSVGKINTYAVFTELGHRLIKARGELGIIVKSGIATDSNTQHYFQKLLENKELVSFFEFENRPWLFQDVATAGVRFCLLTISGTPSEKFKLALFCTKVSDLLNEHKVMSLSAEDIRLFNPNTLSLPIFATKTDLELNKKIYQKVHILHDETLEENPWGVYFKQGLFNMTSDSGKFMTSSTQNTIRLFEPRMMHQFDHRWASYAEGNIVDVTEVEKANCEFLVGARYRVAYADLNRELPTGYKKQWLLGYRNITRSTEIRTMICAVLPLEGVGHNMGLIFFDNDESYNSCPLLLGNLNSLILDYAARSKVSGASIDFFRMRQFPILAPPMYALKDISFIKPRVIELTCTAVDLRAFAEEMGYYGEPFRWDEERRSILRAELDAYYARLYGLTRDDLRYILDPQDVYGEDFPGETFRVLKEKEIRQYGEYRTRRLVLEAWDRLEAELGPVEEAEAAETEAISIAAIAQPVSAAEADYMPLLPAYAASETPGWTVNTCQAVTIAWLIQTCGDDGKTLSNYHAQKSCYFLQRSGLVEAGFEFKEFARGPYAAQATYKTGQHAQKRNYWVVHGTNIAARRNINEAGARGEKLLADPQKARDLVKRLTQLPDDDLGGLATVDFASREIHKQGLAITPGNIRQYFQTDWPEKVGDDWYTDENILRALELLAELGLMGKGKNSIKI